MSLRIAMLTYSVKPRGGVVHALEVSEALARRGHRVELAALARPGEALFRSTALPLHVVRHVPLDDARSTSASRRCSTPMPTACGRSSRPVATTSCTPRTACRRTPRWRCATRAWSTSVIRTVHHVDDFTSPSLIECQDRSIVAPDRVVCVSRPWVERLAAEFGVSAGLVRNGVDARRFRPARDDAERAEARAWAGSASGSRC